MSESEYLIRVDTDDIEVSVPNKSNFFAANSSGVTEVRTNGSDDEISVSAKEITAGSGVVIKVSSKDKVISVNAENPLIEISEEELTATVTTAEGTKVSQTVNDEIEQARIVVTPEATVVTAITQEQTEQLTISANGDESRIIIPDVSFITIQQSNFNETIEAKMLPIMAELYEPDLLDGDPYGYEGEDPYGYEGEESLWV